MSNSAMTFPTWHAGEIALQKSIGVAERMEDVGRRVVRNHLLDQHRAFFPLLSFVVLGSVDSNGDSWATLRAGRPGFLQSPDPAILTIGTFRESADPADAGMDDGSAIALLGIDLRTRRRNRLNGSIRRTGANGFDIVVGQSFGNCPQYIQLRQPKFNRDPSIPPVRPGVRMDRLDERGRALIRNADTFFVASYFDREDAGRQVDVSHRGGKAGFVRIEDDGVLTIPDFPGNLFFNTLGNLQLNPKAGLVFTDFSTGDLMQMTGEVEIILESPDIAAFQGAERLWRFTPRKIVYRDGALPLRLEFTDDGWSPNSLMTGSWADAANRRKAIALANTWRRFRIEKMVNESTVIRSITLTPMDDAGLIPHVAGQHLPLRITLPDAEKPTFRSYTLSTAPSDGVYRISVRNQGVVSSHLHSLQVGDVIEGRAPTGDFTLEATSHRPAVLMAAGIGVTPMLAMLRHIVYEGLRLRRTRPTYFFYAARSREERAFDAEIAELVQRSAGAVHLVRLLTATADAELGRDYELSGRLDIQALRAFLPFDDYEFFICGPGAFMQASYDGLRDLNIADDRIFAEAFGPAAMRRTSSLAFQPGATPATEPTPVTFLASGKEARWIPGIGSLLELAEARGLSPPFSCRSGSCGSCATRIVKGAVAYTQVPAFKVKDGEALLCCSVPAAPKDSGDEARLQLEL